MRKASSFLYLLFFSVALVVLSAGTANAYSAHSRNASYAVSYNPSIYASRLPQRISPQGERVILVNPRVHAWGAYAPDGSLVRGGLASAGSNWCPDLGRPCHTHPGVYRIMSLGSQDCRSHIFPIPRGGAPMPYCMYFHGGQALHGSPDPEVVDGNVSHGCVRLRVQDAEWIRFNFATVGTKVIIISY